MVAIVISIVVTEMVEIVQGIAVDLTYALILPRAREELLCR